MRGWDQFTWSGNLLIRDDLDLVLANRTIPCVIQGDTAATVVYAGKQ